MQNKIQSYLTSIVFHLLAPLIPLIIEYIYTGDVLLRSLTMSSSMYAMLIGITSKSQLMFSVSILISVLLASSYGAISPEKQRIPFN
jgi:hypothetical protein